MLDLPSSLTTESKLNLASIAGSGFPSLGSNHVRFRESIMSASVLVFCGSLSSHPDGQGRTCRIAMHGCSQILPQRALEQDTVLGNERQSAA